MADRPLHIAIDGRELAGRPTGVGRYLRELLRAWASHPTHRFTVVMPAEPGAALRALGPAIAWHIAPAASAGTVWEQVHLPRAVRGLRPDVLFAPAYTAPIRLAVPCVLAVYDVSYFAHPEWFGWREGLRRRLVTRLAARRAAAVVTISEFSRREIARFVGVAADRIVLAPPGSPALEPVSASAPASRTILFVGSLFNRRHLPEMLAALSRVRVTVPDARLALVGDNRTAPRLDPLTLARAAGVGDAVAWRAYVDDAALPQVYASARAFVFVSDYEGFAMTPAEALAHGVPVVLEDTEVSREVYGDGAAYVPPTPAAIAAALQPLLTDDRAHQAAVAAGRARLARYSWDASARRVLEALEQAAR